MLAFKNVHLNTGFESHVLLLNPGFFCFSNPPLFTPSADRSILPLVLDSAESSPMQKASYDSAICSSWSTYMCSFPAGCIQNEHPHVLGSW